MYKSKNTFYIFSKFFADPLPLAAERPLKGAQFKFSKVPYRPD